MELDAGLYCLRPFASGDRESLARLANDELIWRNMTNRFPHPYTVQDADDWLGLCAGEGQQTRNFAIEVEGQLVGGIGLELLEGEKEGVGNIGYWIARDYWNRGIATQALGVMTQYAFRVFSVRRLQACVFGWNPASGRVLEKCGFELEGRLRGTIIKGGEVTDELWYGLANPDTDPTTPT
jgi:RimJ/RimL family protein N-acetyltransferase